MKSTLARVGGWLITIAVPFLLIMLSIRVVFTPVYLQVVYRMPGFPTDPYGFTLEDRLHYGRVSLEYLFNDQGIDFLANQQLPDGSPLYNQRELSHMVDVKVLLQKMQIALDILVIVFIILVNWALFGHWMPAFLHALGNGGKLTLALIALVLVFTLVSFRALFTGFHEIFFTGNTWLFYYSDSLIRLFPLPLWQYGFILVGLITIIGAGVLIWLERRFGRVKAMV